MPVTAPDREQVRMLAMSIGVREAARQLGLNEDTVCSWARRENWLQAARPVQATELLPPTVRPQALQAKPADLLANALADDSQQTRIALSRATRNAAQAAEALPGDLALAQAPNLHTTAKTAALVHAWEDTSATKVQLGLGFFGSPE